MGLFDFGNRDVKISAEDTGNVTKFIIEYPKKNWDYVDIGQAIIRNILKENSVIIHIDTSLCFEQNSKAKCLLKQIMVELRDFSIEYEHRTYKGTHVQSGLGGLLQIGSKPVNYEILTFELSDDNMNSELLDKLICLGCQVFVPREGRTASSLVHDLFEGYFEDNEIRYEVFSFVLYLSSTVKHAALYTTTMSMDDVKNYILLR